MAIQYVDMFTRSVACFAAFALVACAAAGPTETPGGSEAVATVDGQPIHVDDLDIRSQLVALEQKIFDAKMQGLEQKIADILVEKEAKTRGVTKEALLKTEVTDKITAPTDAEVQAFYDQQKARIGRPIEDVRTQIQRLLLQTRVSQVRDAFIAGLREKAEVKVLISAPRVEVDLSQAPVRGPEDAKVTIIEFSDFQCPFCRRVQPALQQIRDKYGDNVRWSFKDLPLNNIHPEAQKAAEAARCAQDQGKFWEYRAAMFAATALSKEIHPKTAAELGLDTAKFEACLDSGEKQAAVQADSDEAQSLGITGTPAFVINGILLSGAQPFEEFQKVIDRELAR